jgi:twinkle protein
MNYTYQVLSHRNLSDATLRKYGIRVRVTEEGLPHSVVFPYGKASKNRLWDKKEFWAEGPINEAGLFGQDLFPPGSAKAITITEGEYDAASVFEMLGSQYPAISLRNGSGGARRDCLSALDYLNSFEKIYLCFDNDEPGRNAVRDTSELFDPNKLYHVKLEGHKDANEFLKAGKTKEFKNIWWNSKRFMPEGVLSTFAEFDEIIDTSNHNKGVPIRFPTLQDMTGGLRMSNSYLFTALEGVGKTEIIRHLEYDILKTTDYNIGAIHLEEPKDRQLKGYAGYELQIPAHLEEYAVSNEEIKAAIRKVFVRDERVHLYSHFGSDDPNVILGVIRYLVAGLGCKFIFLDHITMVVSGLADEDERRALDVICTKLAMMVAELDFCLVFVSHINDLGQTRGSRLVSKVAGTWVELSRDVTNENPYLRNITHLMVKKNRPAGRTGPAGRLFMNPETTQMHELQDKMELPV